MKYTTLNNGVKMPLIGFGIFQVPDDEAETAVSQAIQSGYRLIDTASAYLNETGVGRAISKSNVPREELFITTKLWVQDASYETAKAAFYQSLENLGLDYLDLYLIHQPYNDYYGAWRAMEELYEEGKIRAIGVSNFDSGRLVDLIKNNKVVPTINQVEIHPFFQQNDAIQVMRDFDVQAEAWGPFAEGKNGVFTNETLQNIANAHKKSIAQVILRWQVQRGVVAIPKSSREERIKENFQIWDFELTEEEMSSISTLDTKMGLFSGTSPVERSIMLNSYKF